MGGPRLQGEQADKNAKATGIELRAVKMPGGRPEACAVAAALGGGAQLRLSCSLSAAVVRLRMYGRDAGGTALSNHCRPYAALVRHVSGCQGIVVREPKTTHYLVADTLAEFVAAAVEPGKPLPISSPIIDHQGSASE